MRIYGFKCINENPMAEYCTIKSKYRDLYSSFTVRTDNMQYVLVIQINFHIRIYQIIVKAFSTTT